MNVGQPFSDLHILLTVAVCIVSLTLGAHTYHESCTFTFPGEGFDDDNAGLSGTDVISRSQKREAIELENFYVTVTSSNDTLSAGSTLDNKRVKRISIQGPSNSVDLPKLKVKQDAFLPYRNFTLALSIELCDLSGLSFAFLRGFDKLEHLEIRDSSNLLLSDFASLPPLPSLINLSIIYCSGLNQWNTFPNLINGLRLLDLGSNDDLSDASANFVLNQILQSSKETLVDLRLNENGLKVFPHQQILSFTKLEDLDVHGNYFPLLIEGSLAFSSPVITVDLSSSGVNEIRPGAFQGNFSSALINLAGNNLGRFDSAVFEPILQQMVQPAATGHLTVLHNPFDCQRNPTADLGWLIKDRPELLKVLIGARCDDGTWFEELDLRNAM